MAAEKCVEPRSQRAADDFRRVVVRQIIGVGVLADADRMREQQIALQLLEILRRDGLVLELAEAGGHAIFARRRFSLSPGAAVVLDHFRDEPLTSRNRFARRRIELHARAVAGDAHKLFDSEGAAVESDHRCHPERSRGTWWLGWRAHRATRTPRSLD